MADKYIYPIAIEYIPFGSPIIVTGGTEAMPAANPENANATASPPSYAGAASGYEKGETVRALPFPSAITA